MEHAEIMIVTAHKVYICEDYHRFMDKSRALNTLNIPFNLYYKIGGEWINMSHTPKDIYQQCAIK